MKRRNWKHLQPASLRQAMEWCKDHARERRNLSVERIAERMGLPDHSALYKWMANGRMPSLLIPVYEDVCGINLVSRWLSAAGGKLLIDLPTGRDCNAKDMQELQAVLHTAMGALLAFHDGTADSTETSPHYMPAWKAWRGIAATCSSTPNHSLNWESSHE